MKKTGGLEHLVSEPEVEWSRRLVLGIRRESPEPEQASNEMECSCGANNWRVSSMDYETFGKCLECGEETILHEG